MSLWSSIIKKLNIKSDIILEIGCGTGNLGKVLLYSQYNYVRGVEIDKDSIRLAKGNVPLQYRDKFVLNYFDKEEIYDINYNTVICLDVFEYADCDIEVLFNVKKGAKILFSVPGFYNEAFVIWFSGEKAIKERYGELIEIKEVEELIYNDDCCKRFLVNCIRK